jgi:hypothetical protein
MDARQGPAAAVLLKSFICSLMEIIDASLFILLGAMMSYLLDEVFGVTARVRLWLEKL